MNDLSLIPKPGYFTDFTQEFVGRGGGGHGGGGHGFGGGFGGGHGRGRFGPAGGWWGQGWWPYRFWEEEWYPWFDAGPWVWGNLPWWELEMQAPCPDYPFLGYCPPFGALGSDEENWTYWPGAPGWQQF